jgi:hypothetical protein
MGLGWPELRCACGCWRVHGDWRNLEEAEEICQMQELKEEKEAGAPG